MKNRSCGGIPNTLLLLALTVTFSALAGCVVAKEIQAAIGQGIMLPCPSNYSLNDTYLVQWTRVNETKDELLVQIYQQELSSKDSRYSISFSLGLHIAEVSLMDVGIFKCHVSPSTTKMGLVIRDEPITLSVYGQETRTAKLGEDLTFTCKHSTLNLEDLSVFWIRQTRILGNSLNLTLRNLSFGDVGSYRCIASGSNIAHEVLLSVTDVRSKTINGHFGEKVTFPCPSSSELRNHTDVYWKKFAHGLLQGIPIGVTSPGYTISSDFSLTIGKVSPGHEGIYECHQPATQEAAGVLHRVSLYVFALPTTPPLIDGCRNDGKPCEQTILAGTHTLFTCTIEHIYPERYPTWGERNDLTGKIINSDGTFTTSSSIIISGTDTPTERHCSFTMETFHGSSHLVVKVYQDPIGWMISTYTFGFMFLLSFSAVVYTLRKHFWRCSQKSMKTHESVNQADPDV